MIKTDCRYFRGDIPCAPHKSYSVHCSDCRYYDKTDEQILIIKLGAIGDVIRTTPLLRKIKAIKPSAQITWLTYTPEILSKKWVDRILPVTVENLELLKCVEFDWLINLDKDAVAIALTKSVNAKKKTGFTTDKFGHAEPIATEAEKHKWLTGLFDDLNKENKKHYVEEIFDICGFEFNNEEYIVEKSESRESFGVDNKKKVVGLNTGCGGRWTSRLWPEEYWIELAQKLLKGGYEVILLGGLQEHEKNLNIQKASGAKYFGHYPLNEFIHLVDYCDTVVSAVTMAMHLTIGLQKNLILFNNIFNKNEFYLYNRGAILEPDFECDCYYSPTCKNNCMQYLKPEKVLAAVKAL
jgi:ADP-heptose:LPS heptosyltransferase